jgi:hypothetical protein
MFARPIAKNLGDKLGDILEFLGEFSKETSGHPENATLSITTL